MGGDIIPMLVAAGMAYVYDFDDNEVPGATERDRGYWRDVGTLDAYYDAHMDLVSVHPVFNLYNQRWPIRGDSAPLPPAKFVNGGLAQESIVGPGSIISGGVGTQFGAVIRRRGRRRRDRRGQRPHAGVRSRQRRRGAPRHP